MGVVLNSTYLKWVDLMKYERKRKVYPLLFSKISPPWNFSSSKLVLSAYLCRIYGRIIWRTGKARESKRLCKRGSAKLGNAFFHSCNGTSPHPYIFSMRIFETNIPFSHILPFLILNPQMIMVFTPTFILFFLFFFSACEFLVPKCYLAGKIQGGSCYTSTIFNT